MAAHCRPSLGIYWIRKIFFPSDLYSLNNFFLYRKQRAGPPRVWVARWSWPPGQELCPLNSVVTLLFTLFQMQTGVRFQRPPSSGYTWALVMFQISWVVSRWKALGDLSEGLLPTALRLVGWCRCSHTSGGGSWHAHPLTPLSSRSVVGLAQRAASGAGRRWEDEDKQRGRSRMLGAPWLDAVAVAEAQVRFF